MIRRILVWACAAGGVWGSLRLTEIVIANLTGDEVELWTGEGALIAVPIGIIGALVGAVIGGILFPLPRK